MNKKNVILSVLIPVLLLVTITPVIPACTSNVVKSNVAKTISTPTSKHGYNSLNNKQLDEYYPSIDRESISYASDFQAVNQGKDFSAIDRTRYVYYPETTSIYIYNLNDDGEYKDLSINVSGNNEILDGFAYIASDDSDPLANTFIDVFAGDTQLATYFACGKDPFSTYCTEETLIEFLQTINDDHTLHLSQLLANDNQRDNAILSLLNPKIWDIWLTAAKSNPNFKIDYIDLSNNKLMVYPNLASIPSLYDNSVWMFNDSNYIIDTELLMNDYSSDTDPEKSSVYGGYFKGIDLSHNEFLYFNCWSYMTVDESIRNINNSYDYHPSLLTIVHPIYSQSDMKKILIDLKEPTKLEGYYGVNLDYNHLTYIAYGNVGDKSIWSYLEYQAASWYKSPIEFTIASIIRIRYSYMRCFMTYTVANASNSLIYLAEYLLGWGLYQTDIVMANDKYVTNWLKDFNPDLYHLFTTSYASDVTDEQYMMMQYSLYSLYDCFPFSSIPIDSQIITGKDTTTIITQEGQRYGMYNDLDGTLYLSVLINLYRTSYINSDLKLPTESTDINKVIDALVSQVMSTLSLSDVCVISVSPFKCNYKSWVIIGFTFMMFALIVVGLFGIKFAQNVKKAKIKRGEENDEEE